MLRNLWPAFWVMEEGGGGQELRVEGEKNTIKSKIINQQDPHNLLTTGAGRRDTREIEVDKAIRHKVQ
jgi:hypothetical protein